MICQDGHCSEIQCEKHISECKAHLAEFSLKTILQTRTKQSLSIITYYWSWVIIHYDHLVKSYHDQIIYGYICDTLSKLINTRTYLLKFLRKSNVKYFWGISNVTAVLLFYITLKITCQFIVINNHNKTDHAYNKPMIYVKRYHDILYIIIKKRSLWLL